MPNPGTANNPAGINDFSGPMGEKEPAYGEVARSKNLERSAPVGSPSPDSIPKRAQRRGAGQGGNGGTAAPAPTLHAEAPAMADANVQQQAFWTAVLNDPGASPLARQFAEQALGG